MNPNIVPMPDQGVTSPFVAMSSSDQQKERRKARRTRDVRSLAFRIALLHVTLFLSGVALGAALALL